MIEAFVTSLKRTNKWLFSCVDAHVCFEVEVEGESFVAQLTFIWFFALNNQSITKKSKKLTV